VKAKAAKILIAFWIVLFYSEW